MRKTHDIDIYGAMLCWHSHASVVTVSVPLYGAGTRPSSGSDLRTAASGRKLGGERDRDNEMLGENIPHE